MGSPKPGCTPGLAEDQTLQRIRHALGGGIEAPGLRDDAAVVDVPGGGSIVVSVDSVVAGVHVDLDLCSPADVGWKALMGALSDLAAMGARPLGALVALCVPESAAGGAVTLGLMEGVAEASRESACPVLGGDVSGGTVLMVAVTVLGTVDGGIPVPRHAAVEGDAIFVTGPCGGSAAGLRVLRAEKGAREGAEESARKGAEKSARKGAGRGDESVEAVLAAAYRRPRARLAEGEVARLAGAHAMIDVSDGLALDLHRLADASGVGFVLDTVPVAEGATPDEALGGGEDYELVVVIAPCDIEGYAARCAGAGLRPPLRIGVVRADPAERRLGDDVLGRLGWQHTLG